GWNPSTLRGSCGHSSCGAARQDRLLLNWLKGGDMNPGNDERVTAGVTLSQKVEEWCRLTPRVRDSARWHSPQSPRIAVPFRDRSKTGDTPRGALSSRQDSCTARRSREAESGK